MSHRRFYSVISPRDVNPETAVLLGYYMGYEELWAIGETPFGISKTTL